MVAECRVSATRLLMLTSWLHPSSDSLTSHNAHTNLCVPCVCAGKTLCMDLFLNTLPTVQLPALDDSTNNSSPAPHQQHHLHVAAQRLHFHSFMLGVHQQLHRLQQALPKVVTRSRAGLPVYR